ncbi:CCA tRNA nucleotidyltransferase, partial [Staphylococcus epidermidis]
DYNLSDIECVLTANDTLKENGLEIANPLIINATSIKETDAQLPIHTRKEMDVNGGDIIKHLQVKSGPWLKDVLRQIELAIITQ